MLWDLFCRVVDNFGDVGVCWRAAAGLADRGGRVRLWIDDASALAWMAPDARAGVQVLPWTDADAASPGDVVIESFGCDPPAPFVASMAAARRAPVWIDLEYLSAEAYVERSHGLPSPQPCGLTKWFFFPGFTPRTGGLLREPDLLERQRTFDAKAWQGARGVRPRPGERIVSMFCYENPALPALLERLADAPTLLLAAPGAASEQIVRGLGPSLARGLLRAVCMPHVTQRDFDHLLWTCDLNFVRGEDSFVRAQWAAKPFVWHIYPQADGVHADKLHAFADRFLAGWDDGQQAPMRAFWDAWNGLGGELADLPPTTPWRRQAQAWRDGLLAQSDLLTQLVRFVRERR